MTNPTNGTVFIEIDGEKYSMRLNWHGVAMVRNAYPDGYNLTNPEQLAVIMSIAMASSHPDMTPERIMDLSPPLEKAIEAVTDLVNFSWWGSRTPPERKEDDEAEKENPPKKKATKASG